MGLKSQNGRIDRSVLPKKSFIQTVVILQVKVIFVIKKSFIVNVMLPLIQNADCAEKNRKGTR